MRNQERTRFANPTEVFDPNTIGVDILLNDASPSMDDRGFEEGKKKRDHMHEAQEEYLGIKMQQRPQDYVAIIGYSDRATLCCGCLSIQEGRREIQQALKKVRTVSGGGTRMEPALKMALDLVRGEKWARKGRVLVRVLAYSDGIDESQEGALRYAGQLKSLGVLIETFGIARSRSEVAEDFLRRVASETNGLVHYRYLGDGDLIRHTFKKLAMGALVIEG